MEAKQYVVIKGRNDGIDIWMDDKTDFAIIAEELVAKLSRTKGFFEKALASVSFSGRNINQDEEQLLLDILKAETSLEVSAVKPSPPAMKRSAAAKQESAAKQEVAAKQESTAKQEVAVKQEAAAKQEVAAKNDSVSKPTPPPKKTLPTPSKRDLQAKASIDSYVPPGAKFTEYNTAYFFNGLRSGQSLNYNGSIVLIGDTNAGSEIIATGNVIVLGSLKGMVHAGAEGDELCFVSALSLVPTQLRIAECITYISGAEKEKKKARPPSYAYIMDGRVCIAEL